jgi:hypothetical protein
MVKSLRYFFKAHHEGFSKPQEKLSMDISSFFFVSGRNSFAGFRIQIESVFYRAVDLDSGRPKKEKKLMFEEPERLL